MKLTRVFFLPLVLSGFLSPAFALEDETLQLLTDIKNRMKNVETLQTAFTQHKRLRIFEREVELKGTVVLKKPDAFAWRTSSPMLSSTVFQDGKVQQWNEDTDKVESFDVSAAPVMKMMVHKMKTWFYGDYAGLTEEYEIHVLEREPVTLEFIPRESSPAFSMIRSVHIRFKEDRSYIDRMEIEEKNGDVSRLDFSGTVLNEPVPPEVWNAKHG